MCVSGMFGIQHQISGVSSSEVLNFAQGELNSDRYEVK
jgi:hypothetical protein